MQFKSCLTSSILLHVHSGEDLLPDIVATRRMDPASLLGRINFVYYAQISFITFSPMESFTSKSAHVFPVMQIKIKIVLHEFFNLCSILSKLCRPCRLPHTSSSCSLFQQSVEIALRLLERVTFNAFIFQ